MGETQFITIPVTTLEGLGLCPDRVPTPPFVLVVDDDRALADTLAEILRVEGFAAIATYDAESALEVAKAAPPRLVVTDICMPGMNGIDLAVQLKQMIPDCGVLLFSSLLMTDEILEDALGSGHRFKALPKAATPSNLIHELRKLASQN